MLSDRCRIWVILAMLFVGCAPSSEEEVIGVFEEPFSEAVEDSIMLSEEDSAPDTLTLSEMSVAELASLTDSLRAQLCRSLGRCRISPYDKLGKRYARRWGFDWRLISAQIFAESHFREKAESSAGALGLMQIMPSTAKWLGVDPSTLLRPDDNISLGCYYNRKLYDLWKDRDESHRLAFTFASYNAGPTRVRRATRRAKDPHTWDGIRWHLPGQTRIYVARIFRKYEEYKMIIP